MNFGDELADEAAHELVKAAADGLLDLVRKIPDLWTRSGERKRSLMSSEIERSISELRGAIDRDPAVAARQQTLWVARFRDLLAEYPDTAADLAHVVTRMQHGHAMIQTAESAVFMSGSASVTNGRDTIQGAEVYINSPVARRVVNKRTYLGLGVLVQFVNAHALMSAATAVVVVAGIGAGIAVDHSSASGTSGKAAEAPYASALPAGLRTAPSVRWHIDTAFNVGSPTVVGTRVLFTNGVDFGGSGTQPPELDAVSLSTGRKLWSVKSPLIFGFVPVGTNRVAVSIGSSGRKSSTIEMLDMTDGHLVWQAPGGTGPLSIDGPEVLSVPDAETGGLIALDIRSGARQWTKPNGIWFTSPMVPDTLYGTIGLTMQEVDLATGAVRHVTTFDRKFTYPGAVVNTNNGPAVVVETGVTPSVVTSYSAHGLIKLWNNTQLGDLGYLSDGDGPLMQWTDTGTVQCLDPNTGHTVWSYTDAPAGGTNVNSDPFTAVLLNNSLNLAILNTPLTNKTIKVSALDMTTGELRWSVTYPTVNGVSVAQARDVFYTYVEIDSVGQHYRLHALDSKTGAELWSTLEDQDEYGSVPVAINGGLLLATDHGLTLLATHHS